MIGQIDSLEETEIFYCNDYAVSKKDLFDMKRFHIALAVNDLQASIADYS